VLHKPGGQVWARRLSHKLDFLSIAHLSDQVSDFCFFPDEEFSGRLTKVTSSKKFGSMQK
jgi:hypothetical protein